MSIDPYGNLYLCESCDHHKWSVFQHGFDYCWEKLREERQKEIEIEIPCGGCENEKYCFICAPMVKYEYGTLCRPEKECLYAATIGKLIRSE